MVPPQRGVDFEAGPAEGFELQRPFNNPIQSSALKEQNGA
jgi:hypothetical protein